MPRAAVLLKETPHYRRDAFCAGMWVNGYSVTTTTIGDIRPDDVLVCWNRYAQARVEAQRFEAAGARVIVAENGFVGSDEHGRKLYQLALDYHNGAGRWPVGTEDRWSPLGIKLKPWRAGGAKILILPQRIVGEDGVAMPKRPEVWAPEVREQLRQYTGRPIEIRYHPGNVVPKPSPDWANVHAVVTWGSTAGLKAICAGIPVCHLMPGWIGRTAASFGLEHIENPWMGDRLPMLHRMSWAQWTVEEIASGEPFARLLAMGERAAA
jgi:hypothetical protein